MEISSALIVDEVKKYPDGRVDLLGLFEDIYLDELPVLLDRITLFLDLELAPEDKGKRHTMELRLIDATGTMAGSPMKISFDVPAPEEYPRSTAQLDLDFVEVPFHKFGDYHIDIMINRKPARRLHLTVQPKGEVFPVTEGEANSERSGAS